MKFVAASLPMLLAMVATVPLTLSLKVATHHGAIGTAVPEEAPKEPDVDGTGEEADVDGEECYPGLEMQEDGTCNIPALDSGKYKIDEAFMDFGKDSTKGKGPRCPSYGGDVERIAWPMGDKFAEDVANRNMPVVITGTDVENWVATQRWTKNFIKRHIFTPKENEEPISPRKIRQQTATIPNSKTELGEISVFTIRSHSRTGETLDDNGAPFPGNYTNERLDLLTIVEDKTLDVEKTSKRLYSYHSGPFEKWGADMEANVTPMDKLRAVPKEMSDQFGDDAAHGIIHVGEAGVAAQIHHDRNRNFFGQITGTKRVLLFEPASHFNLYVYPITHPSRRQSQVHFLDGEGNVNTTAFPGFAKANCIEATIGPGDLLYIPPFWSHFVQYLDFAASYSVVSPSIVEWLFSRLYHLQKPIEPETPANEKALIMANLIATTLVSLNRIQILKSGSAGHKPGIAAQLGSEVGDTWAERFVTLVRRSRFDHMEPFLAPLYSEEYKNNLQKNKNNRKKDGTEGKKSTKCWFKNDMLYSSLQDVLQTKIPLYEEFALEFRNLLTVPHEKVKDALLSDKHAAATEILLSDWLEDMSREAVGSQQIPIFMDCVLEVINDLFIQQGSRPYPK